MEDLCEKAEPKVLLPRKRRLTERPLRREPFLNKALGVTVLGLSSLFAVGGVVKLWFGAPNQMQNLPYFLAGLTLVLIAAGVICWRRLKARQQDD